MSMPNLAAQTLQRQILAGTYKTGQMLPGQRDLADTLGISRASLREALSMLEALGFIRSLPGKGTLVTAGGKSSADSGSNGTHASAPSSTQLQATFQLRYVFEPAAAALAARLADSQATVRLWRMQARFEETLNSVDLVNASQADLEFHQLIAELSGNPGLLQVTHDFASRISDSLRRPFADHTRIWESAAEHRAIVTAIAAGDADAARAAMQTHMLQTTARAGLAFVLP
jgi:GntR family transcriptional repressor for pyruvate dehydrogenase complex